MCFDYFLLEGRRFKGEEVSVGDGGGERRRSGGGGELTNLTGDREKKRGGERHRDEFIRALDAIERKRRRKREAPPPTPRKTKQP